MSEILKVKVQDENGNVFYIHTSADVVFCADGTSVQDRLGQKLDKSVIIQNATTAATDKVPSAAVAKDLQDQINQQNTKNTVPISKNSYINGEVTCDIRNNTAYINGRLNFTGTYGDGWKTMASGFPKTGTVYIPCQYGPMQITPEGTLQFYPATNGKEIFYINCSYCL